ncbi:fungal specific transcription factor domain-containing [Fusarium albosuccineum]|uniref:Fungal specific transcription factor domain-containing n=1 Tax=Fusarium albosuccineum TaxID=1237068 RepID=A0A8H4LN68_9HYPO|nr:fungal specific transcription factor domain-containing [Fusarium albosuccineum]
MSTAQYTNSLLRCVARKEVCKSFGIKVSPNAQLVQVARHAGFDSIFIDLEHAWLTLAEASNLCNVGLLSGITPFVRVPHQCGNGFVQRVLDGGAMGVVFPHIENAEEAKAAVKISKYPPQGCRSMTGTMPLFNMQRTPLAEAIEFGNSSGSTVFAMIESQNAVNNSAEIAAVEGVDVLLVGSNDRSIDMGVGGNWDSKEYRSSMEQVSQACRKHNKIFGVAGVYDNPTIHEWFINTLGARFMLVQQDLSLIASGGRRAVNAVPKYNAAPYNISAAAASEVIRSASPRRTRTPLKQSSSAAIHVVPRKSNAQAQRLVSTVRSEAYLARLAHMVHDGKIAELESRLARYEHSRGIEGVDHSERNNSDPPATSPEFVDSSENGLSLGSPVFDAETPVAQSHEFQSSTLRSIAAPHLSSPNEHSDPERGHRGQIPGPYRSTIAAESALSSSNEFGRKVQEVLTRTGSVRSGDAINSTPSPPQHSIIDFSSSVVAPTATGLPQLPPEEEAFRLLETISFFIGQTQSHYDSRELSDRVGLLYENPDNSALGHDLWYMEVVLVLAIGKLFAADVDHESQRFPGSKLFEFVEQRFPSMSAQYRHGRLAVEVNALMSMYLQMTNRKEEAHLYINSALRLAVLHGYHQGNVGRKLLRSEKVHINRLWWTIYMQERRLAAATGTPFGINDDAISIPLPPDAPEFPSGAATRTNVKIARVTGEVISILYGTKFKREEDFVHNAQQIIKSLSEIAKEIPSEQSLTLSGITSELALRTSGSLHLMLYQLILSGNQQPSDELSTGSRTTMSKTCTEAARRLLRVIIALRNKDALAIFGFFDCDAIFSAAFIMLLAKIFDSACEPDQRINPAPGLQEAMEMLQYLADRGNAYARQRFREVQSVWGHLSAILQVPNMLDRNISPPNELNRAADGEANRHTQLTDLPEANPAQNDASLPNGYHPSSWDTLMWNNPDMWPHSMNLTGELADLPLGDSFDQYQALFNDPDWALTGQDVGDFAELRKHLLRLNP